MVLRAKHAQSDPLLTAVASAPGLIMQESSRLPLLPGMIDSHFHYPEMKKKGIDAEKIIKECFDSGMEAMVDVSINVSNYETRLKFALKNKNYFISAGISPWGANDPIEEIEKTTAILETHVSETKNTKKLIAVGETGLDWHWNHGTPEKQILLFEKQLEIAQKFDLPVIIHNREADKEVISSLKKKTPSRGGIIHCFSSDYNFASSCIDMGFLISFAGNVTYPKCAVLAEVAKKIPASSILIETDAPYLSPQEKRAVPNNPGLIGYTYKFIAEQRGEDINTLILSVKENFIRLFGL
ncbi:MAG: TatD family hydrolase [Spirochaetes bacterium]|nr:TatD family hydrolase [Spirochaetota bacterium]